LVTLSEIGCRTVTRGRSAIFDIGPHVGNLIELYRTRGLSQSAEPTGGPGDPGRSRIASISDARGSWTSEPCLLPCGYRLFGLIDTMATRAACR